jgi:hypothetical protein
VASVRRFSQATFGEHRESTMKYARNRMNVAVPGLLLFVAVGTVLGQNKSPVAPTEQAYNAMVKEAYDNFKSDMSGKNADYISALAQVNSQL